MSSKSRAKPPPKPTPTRTPIAPFRATRERMREANEKLVVATVRAEQLAEQTEAARAVAADNEARLRALVDASAAIVWRADAAGRVDDEPAGWREFTGGAIAATRDGDSWLAAVHPDDRERVHALWRGAIVSSRVYSCEHRLQSRGGGYVWVAARAVPILRDGVAREWIGMMTDVSERVEIERAREQFMAILSHDLRSPLAAIAISAETLNQLELAEPYNYLVAEIGKAGKRMTALVDDVLDFARARLGTGIPLASRRCDLARVCADIVAETTRVHPERAVEIVATGDLEGEWDPNRIAQVVSNLVGNAIKHGVGPVRVSLRGDDDDRVALVVENHGPAITPDDLPRLFEPFARARDVKDWHGLGLGLYIVREIVRAHRGTVVASSSAEATTFVVSLPRRR